MCEFPQQKCGDVKVFLFENGLFWVLKTTKVEELLQAPTARQPGGLVSRIGSSDY